MRGFQCFQFAHQTIVFGIGDARLVEHVVAVVGLLDTLTQRIGTGRI